MRTSGTAAVAILLIYGSVCSAGLLQQPRTVPGQTDVTAGEAAGAPTPGEAQHTEPKRGKWRIYDGAFPSLAELSTFPDDPMPIYGLYTSPGLYVEFRPDIKAVGFSSFRLYGAGGGEGDADAGIRAMIADDAFIMIILSARVRDEFDNDEAYIANAMESFARAIERYGPGGSFFKDHPGVPYKPVTCFQVLNEPNVHYMYKGSNDAKMIPIRHKLYAALLPRTYAMMKKRWPSVTVVGWTCGGAARQDLLFVTNALKFNPAMATSFDVFSTHPYTQPAPPETVTIASWGEWAAPDMLNKIREAFAKAGRPARTVPVWYTEGGWRLRKEDGGMFDSGQLSPDLHAAYYVRYYAIGLRMGVARIMPMYTVDADGFNGGIFNRTKGWKRDDAKPMRPVAYAIQTMIRRMPNPRLKRIISDGAEGYFAYEFTCDKRDPDSATAVMAWKVTGGGMTTRIPVSYKRPIVSDMYGTSEPAPVERGAVEVVVGPCPIYITEE